MQFWCIFGSCITNEPPVREYCATICGCACLPESHTIMFEVCISIAGPMPRIHVRYSNKYQNEIAFACGRWASDIAGTTATSTILMVNRNLPPTNNIVVRSTADVEFLVNTPELKSSAIKRNLGVWSGCARERPPTPYVSTEMIERGFNLILEQRASVYRKYFRFSWRALRYSWSRTVGTKTWKNFVCFLLSLVFWSNCISLYVYIYLITYLVLREWEYAIYL